MTGTPIQAAQGVEPQEFIAFHVGEQTYCIDIITDGASPLSRRK